MVMLLFDDIIMGVQLDCCHTQFESGSRHDIIRVGSGWSKDN